MELAESVRRVKERDSLVEVVEKEHHRKDSEREGKDKTVDTATGVILWFCPAA
jgi:phage host-nuclease inhibitor protein Gam